MVDLSRVKFALDGHDEEVEHLAFSSDGRNLATADVNGRVFLWDWATRRKIWGLRFEHPIGHLSVSQSEVVAIDKTLDFAKIPISLNDPAAGPELTDPLIDLINKSTYPGEKPKLFPGSVAVSRDSPFAVSNDSEFCLIGGRSGRDWKDANYHWCAALSRKWGPDGKKRYSRASVDHRYPLLASALSPDTKLCASGDAIGLILVWNPMTAEVKHRFEPFGKGNLSVDFGDSPYSWRLGRDPVLF